MTDVRDHPDYHDGFFAARDGKLFADSASSAYRAGWNAFHQCRRVFENAGFKMLDGGLFQKKSTIYPDRHALLGEEKR